MGHIYECEVRAGYVVTFLDEYQIGRYIGVIGEVVEACGYVGFEGVSGEGVQVGPVSD